MYGCLNLNSATVTTADDLTSITLDLLDNGAGADLIANDGLYSRFLTGALQGRHKLNCSVTGIVAETQVVDVIAEPANVNHLHLPLCCGSDTESTGSSVLWQSTGAFSRPMPGGVIRISGGDAAANIPPFRILDLALRLGGYNGTQVFIRIQFTAPGEDYDDGTGSGRCPKAPGKEIIGFFCSF
jgi:hypothetical protein